MGAEPLRVGLNLIQEDAFRVAAAPLFEAGLVDALEWAIDERWGRGFDDRRMPPWTNQMLDLYADDDALYGHGVWFSVLSAKWEPCQDRWLRLLERECKRRRYRHVSEHFGFFAGGEFSCAPMLPMPLTDEALAVGKDRLERIASAARRPVGLENTAAFLSVQDAEEQGRFLAELLAHVDGFLLLDLHNLYALAENARLSALELLDAYPLERVREIHVSGGSLLETEVEPERGPVRLDSHDGPAPRGALDLVSHALARCPNLEVVFYERRGGTFRTAQDVEDYRNDFYALRRICEARLRAA